MQEPKTIEAVREIVSRVHYEKEYRVGALGEGYFVQITYDEPDIRTGEMSVQRGRKWYVSPFATESEIVQTCLTAALASAEHQVREHFGYRPKVGMGTDELNRPGLLHREQVSPKLIYGPHFSAKALWEICGDPNSYDAREDPE